MRKAVVAIVVVAVSIWLFAWIGAALMRSSISSSPERAWPFGLGTLSSVPKRYPQTGMSSGATRLIALAASLGINIAPRTHESADPSPGPMAFVRGQLGQWVTAQLGTPTPEIEPIPSESGEYLAGRGADLTHIQQLLLSEEPIVWPQNIHDPAAPLPNLLGHMQLQRVLVGRALDRATIGDRGAWDDLRAAWHLSRSLSSRPEVVSNLVALAMAKMVNAAARKLPLPAPEWLQEMHAFDFRKAMVAAYQVDAWKMAENVYDETTIDSPPNAVRRAYDAVMAPYTRMSAADLADQARAVAVEVASTRACELAGLRRSPAWWNVPGRRIATPNIDAIWERVLRFTPEQEATVRALRLRETAPALPQSACADGRWMYAADGKSFRFSKELGDPNAPANRVPLSFHIP